MQAASPRSAGPAVAVVGAGWAGLAAALELAEAGCAVTLLDSAPTAGGRARTSSLATPLGRFELDNGQHLIVGAYRETLRLIDRLGASHRLHRARLELSSPAGLSLRTAPLPAPLHLAWGLLRARGLPRADRIAMLRLMRGLQGAGWRAHGGETVEALLRRWQQPESLVGRLWAPLCIGALNTLPAQACAQSFAAVLRDTLGAERRASDFVTGLAPLGSLLPDPALARLRELGVELRLRETVRAVEQDERGWMLRTSTGASTGASTGGSSGASSDPAPSSRRYAAMLLALPPWSTGRLLAPLGLDVSALAAFEPEPIATAWAFWPAGSAPALPRWSLLAEDEPRARFGQWLFDRGIVAPANGGQRENGAAHEARRGHVASDRAQHAHVAAVVISVASRLEHLPVETVAAGVADQILEAFGAPAPAAVRVVTERRATFRCTPRRPRLAPDHFAAQRPGLWLAGDWLWPDYPATLEAAVRSGQAAAAGLVSGRLGRRTEKGEGRRG